MIIKKAVHQRMCLLYFKGQGTHKSFFIFSLLILIFKHRHTHTQANKKIGTKNNRNKDYYLHFFISGESAVHMLVYIRYFLGFFITFDVVNANPFKTTDFHG